MRYSESEVNHALTRLFRWGYAALTHRERAIVVRHFGLKGEGQGETLAQIGKGFGVTKERVRQIERNAIKRLREILLEEQSSLATNTG